LNEPWRQTLHPSRAKEPKPHGVVEMAEQKMHEIDAGLSM
jgi:hypothetical protein